MAAVAGIRGFREALLVWGCGGAGGQRREIEWRASSGFWLEVGPSLHCSRRLIHCRLPHTAFCSPNRLLSTRLLFSAAFLLVFPCASSSFFFLLSRSVGVVRNNLGVFFLKHIPSHKNVVHALAEAALSWKWSELMRSTCLSASRDARMHVRAHTSNLIGRFTRRNLKCKTETRVDADSAGRLPRGIFCGRDVPVRFAVGGSIDVAR